MSFSFYIPAKKKTKQKKKEQGINEINSSHVPLRCTAGRPDMTMTHNQRQPWNRSRGPGISPDSDKGSLQGFLHTGRRFCRGLADRRLFSSHKVVLLDRQCVTVITFITARTSKCILHYRICENPWHVEGGAGE